MKRLNVYFKNDKVGFLDQRKSGTLRFTYSPEWLKNPHTFALSRSLPLENERFPNYNTRPFFSGLLPESNVRKKITDILGISEENDFGLLERIGGECAGAIQLLPEGVKPPDLKANIKKDLTDEELIQIVEELPTRPLMAGKKGIRLSLAGAQDKLPIILKNGTFSLPLGHMPSTHIIKPEPNRFPNLAVVEYYCMTLAGSVGLNVPEVAYRFIGQKPCLQVQRYDRVMDSKGAVNRVHQEDFCQALGIPPEKKYQTEGGPTLRDCVSLIRQWSTAPVLDIPQFLDGLIFNIIIGNADAHGKNFAFLYSHGTRRLAPFYDLVSTVMWSGLTRNLAMKIGGCESVNAFSIGDWKRLAERNSLSWPRLRERLETMSHKILNENENVLTHFTQKKENIVQELHSIIKDRATRLLDMPG